MKRVTLILILVALPNLAGVQAAMGVPITGTMTMQFQTSGTNEFYVTTNGNNLFGNIPSAGAIAEVATDSVVVSAPNYVLVPLPTFADGTRATIDDVFFTIVPKLDVSYTLTNLYDLYATIEVTYSGNDGIDLVVDNPFPPLYGTMQFVVKVWAFRTVPVSSAPQTPVTEALELSQNRPNPFRPPTAITFDLPRPDHVRLEVFDVSGESVAVLLDRSLGAGSHTVNWDGRADAGGRLPPGQYYYRLGSDHGVETKKMILLR